MIFHSFILIMHLRTKNFDCNTCNELHKFLKISLKYNINTKKKKENSILLWNSLSIYLNWASIKNRRNVMGVGSNLSYFIKTSWAPQPPLKTISHYFTGRISWILWLEPLLGCFKYFYRNNVFGTFIIYCLSAINIENC
jgi:hypothetical protein